jgi:hypothetical protein
VIRLLLALLVALPLLAQTAERPVIRVVSANDATVTYQKIELPRIALDPERNTYHVKGCPLVTPDMQWAAPAAATLLKIEPHSCARGVLQVAYTTHTAKRRPRDPKVVSVLFLGNSMTYFNDLPRMTEALAKGEARPMRAHSVTLGGASLDMLWYGTKALEALWLEHWDYVIVQERSGRAPHDRGELFHKFLGMFADEIRRSGAQPLLYMTWLPDRAQANETLFRTAATRARAKLVPAGIAFTELTKTGLNLYADGTHPNVAGSYLVACTVFSTIYGKPAPATRPVNVAPDIAASIRGTVWRAVNGK